jgi:hypothetical protein
MKQAFLFLFSVVLWTFADGQITLSALKEIGSGLLSEQEPDEEKKVSAEAFLQGLTDFLTENGPDSVTTQALPFVSCLVSPDETVRVYSWALKRADDSYRCFGIVYSKPERREAPRIFVLEDKSELLKNVEQKNLGRTSWPGCIYYAIYPIAKGARPMYLLLGYGGHYPPVRRKVAEVLTFSNTGEVQFGAPLFKKENKIFNRVVLEYSALANVSLKFYPELRTLVFDFLAPQSEKHLGNPAFYGPVGSYDGFQLKGKTFTFIKDIDMRNPDENKGNTQKPVEKKIPPR